MEHSETKIINLWLRRLLPIAAGAVIGYAYYYFIGCSKGCPITGNPWISTLWGGIIGSLMVDWKFRSIKMNEENREK